MNTHLPPKRSRHGIAIVVSAFLALAIPILAQAQTAPKLLPFQGRLTDQNGLAVSNGVRVVQFKIYDVPTGGSPVWAGELHRTTVNGGLVNVMLGTKTPLTGVDFDRQLYLEITVDVSGPTGQPDNAITEADPPMLPRQAILPVVFAKEAANSRLLDGYDWSALFGTNNPATGSLLASKIREGSINGSKLQPATVTSNQIAGQTITSAQIAPNTITSNELSVGIIGGMQLANSSIATNHFTPELFADAINPPGSVIAWMGTNSIPPAGWEFCWGQPVERTHPKYIRLFSVIGTQNGAGNGSTTFNLPDLRAMFLRGVNGDRSGTWSDPDVTSRQVLGEPGKTNAVGSLQEHDFSSHVHTLPTGEDAVGQGGGTLIGYVKNGSQSPHSNTTAQKGGREDRPNNVYVHYLIKL